MGLPKELWTWMGHAAHLVVAADCRFHLATYVGGYIVSTVGEYWPDRQVREIHANAHDPDWLLNNCGRIGDDFDHAYMQRFGFHDIGLNRKYETYVFRAGPRSGGEDGARCCPFEVRHYLEVRGVGTNDAGDAYANHLRLCEEYAARREVEVPDGSYDE